MSPKNSSFTSATFSGAEAHASSASPPNEQSPRYNATCGIFIVPLPPISPHTEITTSVKVPEAGMVKLNQTSRSDELMKQVGILNCGSILLVVAPRFVNWAGSEQNGTSPSATPPEHSSFAGACARTHSLFQNHSFPLPENQ